MKFFCRGESPPSDSWGKFIYCILGFCVDRVLEFLEKTPEEGGEVRVGDAEEVLLSREATYN